MCKFIIACLISLSALSFSSCTQKKVATSVAYMDFPQTIELKARVQPFVLLIFVVVIYDILEYRLDILMR